MTPGDARRALSAAGVACSTIAGVGDGWSSWTFEVDSRWIVQFPRNAAVARSHDRERRLLPDLADHVSFAVPRPRIVGKWLGVPFQRYEKIGGETLTSERFDPSAVAAMVRELHTFPVVRARALLGDEGTVEEWRTGYESFWQDVEARVLPRLVVRVANQVRDEYERFLSDLAFEPVVVHRDLGIEHILLGTVPAIIDFEEVAVGDPAIDFVGIFNSFGLEAVRAVIGAYGRTDADFAARLRFYRWMGSVHAVLYAIDVGDDDLLVGALTEIERRIAVRPRACAAVVRDGLVLMVQNSNLFWTLPGGGIAPGESEASAALRELREEAGVEGRIVRELYRRTYGMGPEVCFLVEAAGEPVVTGDPDVSDVRWLAVDDLVDDWQVGRVRAALAAESS